MSSDPGRPWPGSGWTTLPQAILFFTVLLWPLCLMACDAMTRGPSRHRDLALGPGAGGRAPQHLAYWETHCSYACVINTISIGYRLQFCHWPPPSGINVTLFISVTDPAQSQVLLEEIKTLLDKGAIVEVPPPFQADRFYSTYFLIPKKDGASAGTGPQGSKSVFEGAALPYALHLRGRSGNLSRRMVYIMI